MPNGRLSQGRIWLHRYWADSILLIMLFVIAEILLDYVPTFDRFVLEKDPALSFPFTAAETVPQTELLVYTGLFAILALWLTQFVAWRVWPDFELLKDPIRPSFAMLDAWAFALFLTNMIKRYVGRPRPNYFAYCDYKGYREALTTGNFTSYDSSTLFGRPMLASACDLLDARHSFPSGHSAFSMASLLSLSLFWYGIAELQQDHKLFKMFVCAIPPLLAIVVAGSRTRDYYHNFEDILAGSLIGATSAIMCFIFNYNSQSRRGSGRRASVVQVAVSQTPEATPVLEIA